MSKTQAGYRATLQILRLMRFEVFCFKGRSFKGNRAKIGTVVKDEEGDALVVAITEVVVHPMSRNAE